MNFNSPGRLTYKAIPAGAAITAEPSGRIVALVNSTEQRDKQDDIVHKGAWQKVIASGRLPKILLGHDWSHLPVAKATALDEWMPGDPRLPSEHQANGWGALTMDAQCDMNREAGRDFYSAVAGGYLSEWSVGFLSNKAGDYFANGARHVTAIDELPEVSGVLVGASIGTQTLATKAGAYAQRESSDLDFEDILEGIIQEEWTNQVFHQAHVEKTTAHAIENVELMYNAALAMVAKAPPRSPQAARARDFLQTIRSGAAARRRQAATAQTATDAQTLFSRATPQHSDSDSD